MKQFLTTTILLTTGLICYANSERLTKRMHRVDFSQVFIDDAFWSPRLKNNAEKTIRVCIDQIENKTGRMRNFEKAAIPEGPHSGIFFDDSDVYKAIEGMAYSLVNNPDPLLEQKVDEWIAKIAAAQQSDGYINTFFTIQEPQNRWNDMDKHEMYCAGHLLEAGIAYYKATGKRTLLDVGQHMADHMMTLFGPNKRTWVPGHEEIELALVKLYQVTGEHKYLEFSHWLLEERGHELGKINVRENIPWDKRHYQDIYPVKDLTQIYGHAVRAMYLFCGMADIDSYIEGTGYMEALNRVWEDVINTRMYITGGIGVAYMSEGFSEPYDLPNFQAYCETCASIGMVLWNHRMAEASGDGKYTDIMERSLYNGVLSGISLNGDRFFYVNPLASHGDHHRQEWYGCACCPSNVCRFIPSIGNYIYGTSDDALWVNLYIGNSAKFKMGKQNVEVEMNTQYPWEGHTQLTLKKKLKGNLRLHIPAWSKTFEVCINGEKAEYKQELGYAIVSHKWKAGDQITIDIDMPVEYVYADPRVKEDVGKCAIQRGPIVYCAEEIDNPGIFESMQISSTTDKWQVKKDNMLNGIYRITNGNYNLIPYYSWDNREPSQMKVWIDNK